MKNNNILRKIVASFILALGWFLAAEIWGLEILTSKFMLGFGCIVVADGLFDMIYPNVNVKV